MRKKLGAQKLAEHRSTGPRPMVKGVRRPYDQEVSVRVFPQMWGSTALGYGGLGGAAMSTAYTVVVQDDNVACVYFGSGHLGYSVPMRKVTSVQLEAFRADLQQQQLAERRDAVSTYGATLPAGPVRD